MKICPKTWNFCRSSLIFFQTKNASSNVCQIFLKCQNFAKSGHTAQNHLSHFSLKKWTRFHRDASHCCAAFRERNSRFPAWRILPSRKSVRGERNEAWAAASKHRSCVRSEGLVKLERKKSSCCETVLQSGSNYLTPFGPYPNMAWSSYT